MKKLSIYLSAIVMGAIMSSCGEAGVEANVSKNSEIEFNVTNLTLTGKHTVFVAINFAADEFEEYQDGIVGWDINKIEFQITGVQGDKFTLLDPNNNFGSFSIVLDNSLANVLYVQNPSGGLFPGPGEEAFPLITNSNNQLRTTEKYTLYDKNGGAVRGEFSFQSQIVDDLLELLENREVAVFTVSMEGDFENANITVKLFVDVTAKTELD